MEQNNIIKLNEEYERPWGNYKIIAYGEGFQSKIITVKPKQKLSVQSHNHRSEHWVVLSGLASVLLDNKTKNLLIGQSINIPVKAIHSLENKQDTDLKILEVQFGAILSEEDIIRYQDIYGRV